MEEESNVVSDDFNQSDEEVDYDYQPVSEQPAANSRPEETDTAAEKQKEQESAGEQKDRLPISWEAWRAPEQDSPALPRKTHSKEEKKERKQNKKVEKKSSRSRDKPQQKITSTAAAKIGKQAETTVTKPVAATVTKKEGPKEADRSKSDLLQEKPVQQPSVRRRPPPEQPRRPPPRPSPPPPLLRKARAPLPSRNPPPMRRGSPPQRRMSPLPPPRRRSPPPPAFRRMSPPPLRLRSPPPGIRDRYGPHPGRPRSPPPGWRSPPRRPLSPLPGMSPRPLMRPRSPPAGYYPSRRPERSWSPGPLPRGREPFRPEGRGMSPRRYPHPEDELRHMKRPRLDEGPNRRIQSEWERLKEYENELLRKELALRDREREGLSAPPLNAQMSNGWGNSDPSSSRVKGEPAPWANGGGQGGMQIAEPWPVIHANERPVAPASARNRNFDEPGYSVPPGLDRPGPHPRDRRAPPQERQEPTVDRLPPSRLPPLDGRRTESLADWPRASDRSAAKQSSQRAKSPPKVKTEERASKKENSQRDAPALERRRPVIKSEPKLKAEAVKGAVQRIDKTARPPDRERADKGQRKTGRPEPSNGAAQKIRGATGDVPARERPAPGEQKQGANRKQVTNGSSQSRPGPVPHPAEQRSRPARDTMPPRNSRPPPHHMDRPQDSGIHPARQPLPDRPNDFHPLAVPPPWPPGMPPDGPDMEMVAQWFYRDPQGQLQGPASLHQLRLWLNQLANQHDKSRHHVFCQTLVWKDGLRQSALPLLQLLERYP